MADKLVIYAGAPPSSTLDWDSPGQLSDFDDAILRFVAGPGNTAPSHPDALSIGSAPKYSAWRTLALERASELHPGIWSPAEFFNTTSISFDGTLPASQSQELISQFYEDSIAIHDRASSQLVLEDETQLSVDATTSFLSTTTTSSDNDASSYLDAEPKQPLLPAAQLSDLKDVPSARYLQSIHPQTMTLNLVVGLISLSPPRTVKTRWGSTHELVEVLVGDDTRAGFAITFWLSPDSQGTAILASLRTGDIVLLQNVALNVFTNKVYGSSLRRNLTKVHLLYRARLDADDEGGYYTIADLSRRTTTTDVHPQLDKTRRVREWVLHFVGGGGSRTKNTSTQRRGGGRSWDVMPPLDTQ